MAERFTKEYNNLLRRFEEEMFNTSKLLDTLRNQFSWVSSLANHTTSDDGIFKIQTVSPDSMPSYSCAFRHDDPVLYIMLYSAFIKDHL